MFKIIISMCSLIIASLLLPNSAAAAIHPDGTNVVNKGTVYFINKNPGTPAYQLGYLPKPTLIPYPSAEVFLSYGFNTWQTVVPASEDDMVLLKSEYPMFYRSGTLVNDKGTVYLISGASRYGIPSLEVFNYYRYKWSSVVNGNTSIMLYKNGLLKLGGAHNEFVGTLIDDNGTINYVSDRGRILIPSMEVFNSWGFKLNKVVPAIPADAAWLGEPPVRIMSLRSNWELNPNTGLDPVPQ